MGGANAASVFSVTSCCVLDLAGQTVEMKVCASVRQFLRGHAHASSGLILKCVDVDDLKESYILHEVFFRFRLVATISADISEVVGSVVASSCAVVEVDVRSVCQFILDVPTLVLQSGEHWVLLQRGVGSVKGGEVFCHCFIVRPNMLFDVRY